VAGLVDVVDLSGDALSRGETVTLLNDLSFFAPGALVDPRLSFSQRGPLTVEVAFANGRRRVTASLVFNERDELCDFTSDDRPALQPDGTLRLCRWSTPVGDYRDLGGRWVATRGDAIYRYPAGDFTYGRFTLTALHHDLDAPPSSPP
jgi:hypothetical protein